MAKTNGNTYGLRQGDQASQPLWSASQVNHLGNVTCFGHWPTCQPAAEKVLALDPESKIISIRVFTSFGKCMFCGKEAGA